MRLLTYFESPQDERAKLNRSGSSIIPRGGTLPPRFCRREWPYGLLSLKLHQGYDDGSDAECGRHRPHRRLCADTAREDGSNHPTGGGVLPPILTIYTILKILLLKVRTEISLCGIEWRVSELPHPLDDWIHPYLVRQAN